MVVLFVCTGNTYRSCLVEAIFNSTCKNKSIKAILAGIAIIRDSITSKNSTEIIALYGDDVNIYFETYNQLKIYIELLIKKIKRIRVLYRNNTTTLFFVGEKYQPNWIYLKLQEFI